MRALLLVLLCGAPVAAGWPEAEKTFRADYAKDAKAAILALGKTDLPEAAELLVILWAKREEDAQKERKELYKLRVKRRALEAQKERKPRKDDALRDEIKAVEAKDHDVNARLAAIELEQAAIREALAGMKGEAVVAWIGAKGLRLAKSPALVETLANKLDVGALLAAIDSERKPGRLIAILHGLARHGPKLAPAVPALLRLLGHRDWAVRVAAAHALAKSAQPAVVEPLIRRLARERERSRAQLEIARALTVLTGKNIGPYADGWRGWWKANEDKVKGGAITLGEGPAEATVKKDQPRFYGIPQAERAIYVFDKSGSMDVSMDNPKWDKGDPIPARDDEDRRYDAARRELMRALGRLRPANEFAVVLYSSHVEPLTGDGLVKAKPDEVARIGKALEHDGPVGSTNIYEALDFALRLAGVHPESPPGPARADAIYLISDGSPTDAKGKAEDPERVLEAVRTWNAHQRVAIHTVGIGRQHNTAFLETLASENGGEYRAVFPKKRK